MTKNLKDIIDYFKYLPDSRIDQTIGNFHSKVPCCFGAHIAHHFLNERYL